MSLVLDAFAAVYGAFRKQRTPRAVERLATMDRELLAAAAKTRIEVIAL